MHSDVYSDTPRNLIRVIFVNLIHALYSKKLIFQFIISCDFVDGITFTVSMVTQRMNDILSLGIYMYVLQFRADSSTRKQ